LKPGQKKKNQAANKPLKTPEPEQSATDEGDEGEGSESKTEEPAPKTKSKGKKKKPDYSKWASVAAFNENKTIISTIGGEETDEHHQTEEEKALGKDLQQKLAVATSRSPTMPDGSPGFTRARTCVAPDLAICSQTSCDS
jgi:La-related protein 7